MKASKYKMDSEFRMEIDRQIRHAMPEMHYHDFYEIYIITRVGSDGREKSLGKLQIRIDN